MYVHVPMNSVVGTFESTVATFLDQGDSNRCHIYLCMVYAAVNGEFIKDDHITMIRFYPLYPRKKNHFVSSMKELLYDIVKRRVKNAEYINYINVTLIEYC